MCACARLGRDVPLTRKYPGVHLAGLALVALLTVACGSGGGGGTADSPAGGNPGSNPGSTPAAPPADKPTVPKHSLAVTIEGLPDSDTTPANVMVTGPNGYQEHLISSKILEDLEPGEYTITTKPVVDHTQPGPGFGNGGNLGLDKLERHPYRPVQKVEVNGKAEVAVSYPDPAILISIPDASQPKGLVTMVFVLIPAGSFTMGDNSGCSGSNAQPAHTVTFKSAFYAARTPCTQEQWQAVMKGNPSWFSMQAGGAEFDDFTRPVERVSWDDVRNPTTGFLDRLKAAVPGYGFRLPSEAEYEYAARAKATTRWFCGDTGMGAGLSPYLWTRANAAGTTHRAGELRPNPWGLYDISGHVWEWCEDNMHDTYAGAPADGSAWGQGAFRVMRGGSIDTNAEASILTRRGWNDPHSAARDIGFRVFMDVPPGILSIGTSPLPPVAPSLAVAVLGLGSKAFGIMGPPPADVTVTGPNGYQQHLTASGVLTDLVPGEYTVLSETTEEFAATGLGRQGGGDLGPKRLQRYPLLASQKVNLTWSASVIVRYPPPTLTVRVPDSTRPGTTVPVEFALVPPGTFTMGSNDYYFHRSSAVTPAHAVSFDRAFYAARTPCTQELWVAVMESNPSRFQRGPQFPVERVTWRNIRTAGTGFLDRLNKALPGYGFRLPSEAEYEYVLRGGTATLFFTGDILYTGDINWDPYMWTYRNSMKSTHPVGQMLPNPWGFWDITGNVLEWCEDDWHSNFQGAPTDGQAWVDVSSAEQKTYSVIKGGASWFPVKWPPPYDYDQNVPYILPLSANRFPGPVTWTDGATGFRLFMDVPDKW